MIGRSRRCRQAAVALLAVLLSAAAAPARAGDLAAEKARGKEALEKAAQEPGAVRAKSGFVYVELKKGTGPRPWASNTVKVHYVGTLLDGKVFDSSVARGEPAVFPLQKVIKCWTEGLQLMKVGGKAKLVCPPEVAYGDQDVGGGLIPAGSTLVFEVELLAVVDPK